MPTALLAFANDRTADHRYLRNLATEDKEIRKALDPLVKHGLAEPITIHGATLHEVAQVFRKNRDQIRVFHFGGHANGSALLFEDNAGQPTDAHAEGLASYLGQRRGLVLVFLNACGTESQVRRLRDAGVKAVVATRQSIPDSVAAQFAAEFYAELATGSMREAFNAAVDLVKTQHGAEPRDVMRDVSEGEPEQLSAPWVLDCDADCDTWKLGSELATPVGHRFRHLVLGAVAVTLAAALAYGLFTTVWPPHTHELPIPAPSASAILVTPDDREIYVADEGGGRIVVLDNMPNDGGGLKTKAVIDLNRSGSAAHPARLALSPDATTIYVTDPSSDEIVVIDRSHNNEIKTRFSVGRLPRSIAFTPDGNKAYVSNEGPIPQGTISVIDARQHRILGTMTGVNIPEGLALDPAGDRLYIASEGRYGEDAVFVADIRRDRILPDETIERMAVGVGVAVSPKHQKLYVARGNFGWRDPNTGEVGSPFSIIDLRNRHELRTHTLKTSVNLAVVTPDESYVLVANGEDISVVDTETDAIVKTWSFGAAPLGIAVSKANAVYILLPGNQIKLLGLSGLGADRKSGFRDGRDRMRPSATVGASGGPPLDAPPPDRPPPDGAPSDGVLPGGRWTTLAPMPTGLQGPATSVINGKLYVASGCCAAFTPPFPRFNNLQVYDPVTHAWTQKAPIPLAVYFAPSGMISINRSLYVAGAQADQQHGNNVATLQVYDSVADSWSTAAPLPAAGAAAFGGVINGKFYVASGQDPSNTVQVRTVVVYDPTTNEWSNLAPIPTPRAGGGSGVLNDILYTIGGLTNGGVVLPTMEAYDPATNSWIKRAPMPTARYGVGVGVLADLLFAVGGNDGGKVLDTVEVYNPVTDTWTKMRSLPVPAQLPGVGVINGVLYVAGGFDQSQRPLNHLQAFVSETARRRL